MAKTLSACFNVDRFSFWRSLGFGKLIKADYSNLLDSLKVYSWLM